MENLFIVECGMKKKDKPKKKNEYREYDSFEKSRRKNMRLNKKKSRYSEF
jgi:hypothetical protein